MFYISELKKNQASKSFAEDLDIKGALQERYDQVLDIKEVQAQGKVAYEDGLYHLSYDLSYVITLPSSRSLIPVELVQELHVDELFIEPSDVAGKQDLVEDNLVLVLEGETIDLAESVMDNILLNIPLKVLSPQEEVSDSLPSGSDWTVLTQDQYQAQQEQEKEVKSPFAALSGLFDDE